MATIKALLFIKDKSKLTHPLVIRISKNRKSSYIYLGQYLEEKYWDKKNLRVKKSHPNALRLNNFLSQKLAEANDTLLESESNNEPASSKLLKKKIKKGNKKTSFAEVSQKYIEELERAKKFTRISSEKPRINRFREFNNGHDITFEEINVTHLRRYITYLGTTRNIGKRTTMNHLVVIRTIFNKAIREFGVDKKFYPFGKGKIAINFPESLKIGLSPEEIMSLENLDLTLDPIRDHARKAWLFSLYFAGMRCSDVLRIKRSDFKDDRLYYRMGKNQKLISFRVPEKAKSIINHYLSMGDLSEVYLFPELNKVDTSNEKEIYKAIVNANKKFNKHLKAISQMIGLDKPFTMHIARHTFGNISGDKIPVQMLQKLYRHSDLTTTINYQSNFIYKDEDEALNKVLDF